MPRERGPENAPPGYPPRSTLRRWNDFHAPRQAVEIGVRPEHLRLADAGTADQADGIRLDAEVVLVEQLGESHLVHLRAYDHHELVVRGNAHTRLRSGDRVVAWAPAEALHVFITDGRACRRLFHEGAPDNPTAAPLTHSASTQAPAATGCTPFGTACLATSGHETTKWLTSGTHRWPPSGRPDRPIGLSPPPSFPKECSMPRTRSTRLSVLLAIGAFGTAGPSQAHDVDSHLEGLSEVPSVATAATGKFSASIDETTGSIAYRLAYSGLEGDVRQAHIHFGQRKVNGGIMVFLCQTSFNPDPTGLAPTCLQSGAVTGTLTAANVIGPTGQGVDPGGFTDLVAAIRAGAAYANVHTTKFAGGELRAQLAAKDE